MNNKINLPIDNEQIEIFVLRLPVQYREILSVYLFNDLTKKAVAEKLNLSYGIARNRLSKGIYLLKKITQEEKNTPELLS